MRSKSILFVDLDRTLFDTSRFVEAIRNELKLQFQVVMTTNEARNYYRYYEDLYDYDFFKHCQDRGVTSQQIYDCIFPELLIKYGSFLYEDVRSLLGTEFEIMTFGSEPYQSLKLKMAPELQDRAVTIVHERKGAYINREFKNVSVTLIDDKPAAMTGYSAGTFIHLDRAQKVPIINDESGIHIRSLNHTKEVLS